MSAFPGKPPLKTCLLQGPPGAGKSMFIRRYAYEWSTPAEGGETEEQKLWSLIVILPVSTLRLPEGISTKDQILEAVRQNLYGSEVQAIMEHLENEKMRVLLIPDGIDEFQNETTMKMLKDLIKQCHENKLPFSVLATCRSGLCPITHCDFERIMKIEGFTLDEGVQYVLCYYREIEKQNSDSIKDYVFQSKKELYHILTNPLCTHIFCVVTAHGTLELIKGQKVALKQLLEALEKTVKKRQVEKDGRTSSGNDADAVDIEDQTRRFYMLSLFSLLEDIRTFDDHHLEMFAIDDKNPYFSFMEKKQFINHKCENILVWQFTHEMWHEYLASCAIQALPEEQLKYFLLQLCSDSKLRNAQRILFSALGPHQEHLNTLSGMVCVIVMLQSHNTNVIREHSMSRNIQLLSEDSLDILLHAAQGHAMKKTTLDASRACTLWDDTLLRINGNEGDFLSILLDSTGPSYINTTAEGLLPHIYGCITEVPEEKQQRLFASSIGRILPWKM